MLNPVTTAALPARTGTTLLARVIGQNGQPITQASLSSPLSVVITDLSLEAVTAGSGNVGTLSPAVAATVFDSLQIDALWTLDSSLKPGPDGLYGYNFKFTVPAAQIANGGDRYRADVVFSPIGAEPFRLSFEWWTSKVYG